MTVLRWAVYAVAIGIGLGIIVYNLLPLVRSLV